MPSGSKDMSAECGLWRENVAWVKEIVGGVWSRRENLSSGSRRPAVECGLGGRICRVGQGGRRWSVVCGEKTPSGSRRPSVECGLGGRTCRAGQRTCRWSVVCGEKTPSGSKDMSAECGLEREITV